MYVLWIGSDLYKGYHDPRSGRVDVIASRIGTVGRALAVQDFEIVVDEGGALCNLALEVGDRESSAGLPERPATCVSAVDAEVEVVEEAGIRWCFEPRLGTLRVAFDGVEPARWGRLGENLVWLALDAEARLAALVVEGISRDPGGKGQAAWLEELGVG